MYIGNGVTKKFQIPEGRDGSIVVLTLESGKTILLKSGDGYQISGGYVLFETAIPSGVRVSFDADDDNDSLQSTGYVVIYGDGRIREVNEDPAEYLEQLKDVLREAVKQSAYIVEVSRESESRILRVRAETESRISEALQEYETRAMSTMSGLAEILKAELLRECEVLMSQIPQALSQLNEGLTRMESLKEETRELSRQAANESVKLVLKQSAEILEAYAGLKALRDEAEYYSESAKSASRSAVLEASKLMNAKVNEELEVLKSLRMKLELDMSAVNKRLTSAWEVLSRELHQRR